MGSRAQTYGRATQAGYLRHAQSRLYGHEHERMVTPARPGAQVWCEQNRVDLRSGEKTDLCACAALVRDGQDPLNLRCVGRHLERRIPKKRTDGRQSQVAAGCTDTAAGLQIVEVRSDQRCVDLLELQPLRRNAEMLLCELQEQPKAVAVRTDGMGTGLALLHQPTREEALQESWETGRGHDRFSQRCSMRSIASRMSCGWALRYQ